MMTESSGDTVDASSCLWPKNKSFQFRRLRLWCRGGERFIACNV